MKLGSSHQQTPIRFQEASVDSQSHVPLEKLLYAVLCEEAPGKIWLPMPIYTSIDRLIFFALREKTPIDVSSPGVHTITGPCKPLIPRVVHL